VASLLDSLRKASAHEQAAALTDRLSAAGMFVLFLEQNDPADQFRFGRRADGTPAAPWGWEDLNLWLVPVRGDTLHRRSPERDVHVGRHATRQPRPRPSTPNRRDELNNTHPNGPSQFFEAQLAAGAAEEFN